MKYKALLFSLFATANLFAQHPAIHFEIETDQPCQTMDYFGASDCWSMQFIGLWPQEKQNQVADWLFSTENHENGQPKGIGLSLWRFNVGAGSAEQGEASQIASPWMRTECFLQADGNYNWNKQQGQRNFLRLAKERGVNKFLAFLNSPPVYFTQNGLATNTGRGGTLNLKEEHYKNFARFLANVIKGVEKHDGIKFNYLCPFNEPDGHWNWIGPKQEGTPATNREIARAIRLISKEFVNNQIDTQILVNESSDYRCMFDTHMTNWERGYQIQSFFNPDSTATYLGDTPNVPRLMVGHSYWTNTPLNNLHDIRCQLKDTLDKYKVDFWQTETCIMGNDEEIGGGGGYDFTMKTALYVARIIHHDIVYAAALARRGVSFFHCAQSTHPTIGHTTDKIPYPIPSLSSLTDGVGGVGGRISPTTSSIMTVLPPLSRSFCMTSSQSKRYSLLPASQTFGNGDGFSKENGILMLP